MRFAGDQNKVDFDPMSLKSGASGGNYSAAASVVDVGKNFDVMREKAPKFDVLSQQAMADQSAEKQAAMNAEATAVSQGLAAFGTAKGAKLQAEGAIKAAEVTAEASKQSSMMGGIAKIASAGIGLFAGSDERMKDSIEPIETALEQLRLLKPVTFYYKAEYGDPTRKHHGFIAQEMKQVVPDAVYTSEDNGMYCIDTGDLIGLLVRGNQELQARVSRLEAKAALQAV